MLLWHFFLQVGRGNKDCLLWTWFRNKLKNWWVVIFNCWSMEITSIQILLVLMEWTPVKLLCILVSWDFNNSKSDIWNTDQTISFIFIMIVFFIWLNHYLEASGKTPIWIKISTNGLNIQITRFCVVFKSTDKYIYLNTKHRNLVGLYF